MSMALERCCLDVLFVMPVAQELSGLGRGGCLQMPKVFKDETKYCAQVWLWLPMP
jgi:hypothetical protein